MQLKTLLPLALATLTGAQNMTTSSQNMTLIQILSSQNSTLSTLNSLLAGQPALLKTLSTSSGFTLVAPSNDAFSKFLATPANKAAAMDPATLMQVLQYHVLNGVFPASSFTTTQQFIPTMLGASSSMNTTATSINMTSSLSSVTGGQVVGAMVVGGNAVVMSGLKAMSTVQTADLMFNGGVVHIIDNVLTVPPPPSTAAASSNLTSLATGLKMTNLITPIDSLKDVTIFAPSNAAFMAVNAQVSTLTVSQLGSILQYHVINGTVGYSTLLMTGLANESFPTLAGSYVNIRSEQGKVFVNSAQVTVTDVIVSNGVVHVLDNVLNPDNTTVVPDPSLTTQGIAFADVSTSNSTGNLTAAGTNGTIDGTASNSTSNSTAKKAGATKSIETGIAGPMGAAVMAALFGIVAAVWL